MTKWMNGGKVCVGKQTSFPNNFFKCEKFSIEFFNFAFGILKKEEEKTTLSKMAMILKQTNRNA